MSANAIVDGVAPIVITQDVQVLDLIVRIMENVTAQRMNVIVETAGEVMAVKFLTVLVTQIVQIEDSAMQLWIPHDVPTVQKDGWVLHVKIYAYTVTRSLWIAVNVSAMHAIQEEAAISSAVDMEHARTANVDAIR